MLAGARELMMMMREISILRDYYNKLNKATYIFACNLVTQPTDPRIYYVEYSVQYPVDHIQKKTKNIDAAPLLRVHFRMTQSYKAKY